MDIEANRFINYCGLFFLFSYDVLKLMDADKFYLLYSYTCLLIFPDDNPNLMDIKENDFIDCYGLFFLFSYDVLKLMGTDGFYF